MFSRSSIWPQAEVHSLPTGKLDDHAPVDEQAETPGSESIKTDTCPVTRTEKLNSLDRAAPIQTRQRPNLGKYLCSSLAVGFVCLLAYSAWLSYEYRQLRLAQSDLLSEQQQKVADISSYYQQREHDLHLEIADLHLEIISGYDQVAERERLLDSKDLVLAEAENLSLLNQFDVNLRTDDQAAAFADLQSVRSELSQRRMVLTQIPSGMPFAESEDYWISSSYGRRQHPVYKRWHNHTGVDFGLRIGSPVQATADGVVSFVGNNGGYGKTVVVTHSYGFKSYYGHLSKIMVDYGQIVRKSERIALSGNSGVSTGPHLHYEIRYLGKAIKPNSFYNWDMDNYEEFLNQQQQEGPVDVRQLVNNLLYRDIEQSALAQLDNEP